MQGLGFTGPRRDGRTFDHPSFGNHLLYSGRPVAANREAERTIDAYAFSFFNKWIKGQDDHLHESASAAFPRVINFLKK